MVAIADIKRRAPLIVRRLRAAYPDAECALDFNSPLELLIATILSAQCTDVRVNIVTKDLFHTYRTPADYADARPADLERAVQSTGFFRSKAKSIQSACRDLVEKHHSQVPRDLDCLVELRGVGRKTANVVLGTAFGIASGVVVDTHVTRISRRLGLTKHTDAVKIERDLMALIPKKEWIAFSHRMIHHGRRICTAARPKCDICPLFDLCPKVGVPPKWKAEIERRRREQPAVKRRAVKQPAVKQPAVKVW